jgi:hypothetical protein
METHGSTGLDWGGAEGVVRKGGIILITLIALITLITLITLIILIILITLITLIHSYTTRVYSHTIKIPSDSL